MAKCKGGRAARLAGFDGMGIGDDSAVLQAVRFNVAVLRNSEVAKL
jgi:hypothetical protein